jgi:uncharacterized protein (TIGR00251 family)
MDDLTIREQPGSVTFEVRVAPRASRDAVLGVHGGALKVALTAPPVEGAANDALEKLLARLLDVPRRAVTIVRGERSRTKTVRVEGRSAASVRGLVQGG